MRAMPCRCCRHDAIDGAMMLMLPMPLMIFSADAADAFDLRDDIFAPMPLLRDADDAITLTMPPLMPRCHMPFDAADAAFADYAAADADADAIIFLAMRADAMMLMMLITRLLRCH